MTVVERVPNRCSSTFPSEIVTCRLEDGRRVRILCKYGGHDHPAYGHRGGVRYEAEVYRRVLAAMALPVPQFYGAATGPDDEVWLAISYVEPSVRLNDTRDLTCWERAAAWCGRFHAAHESGNGDQCYDFLIEYDHSYYAGWAQRTAENAAAQHLDSPWLADLCRRAEAALRMLLEGPMTVIHGEYYPKNILVSGRDIYPVDWESAALARGEIDLATLTDHCDPEVVSRCAAAYQLARWPDGAPVGLARGLELARLYVHLRWLGAPPGPKRRLKAWRFEEARALGERLGLI